MWKANRAHSSKKPRELFRPKVIFLKSKKKKRKKCRFYPPKKQFIYFPDIFNLPFKTVNILVSKWWKMETKTAFGAIKETASFQKHTPVPCKYFGLQLFFPNSLKRKVRWTLGKLKVHLYHIPMFLKNGYLIPTTVILVKSFLIISELIQYLSAF